MEERRMRRRGGSEGESWRFSHCLDRWTETAKSAAAGMRGRRRKRKKGRGGGTPIPTMSCASF